MSFTALDSDEATVFLDDPIADGQAESCPKFLRCKERGKYVRAILLLNACPIIFNIHPDKFSILSALRSDMEVGFNPGGNLQESLALHGLERVFDQIEKNLREPRPVAQDRGQTGIVIFLHRRFVLLKSLSLQEQNVVLDLVDI